MTATVVRDTAEKAGYGWRFAPSDWCAGTVERSLFTADYALEGCGLEGRILVERKHDSKEVAMNVFEARFPDVLARMSTETDQAFIVCEFPFAYLELYPKMSGLPGHLMSRVQTNGHLLVKRVTELILDFPRVRWQFCDSPAAAQNFARSLFKRLVERAREGERERRAGVTTHQ